MKSFAASLILLAVMLGGMAWNAVYINRVADRLNAMLDAMPDSDDADSAQAAAAGREYWESNAPYVGLSVGYTVTDRVSEQTAVLAACAACGDFYGYRSALALLRDAIGDMRRLEQFSIENLL